ncbi:helix-turn-helix domain-containing protein [Burkholderia cenocepacia]|uniref:MarR family transcriptional regulator n=1 Tax=Burkholderia cenocepacia TaxID=95486 RepID=UPI0020A15C61|nr:helix-turn-helix domain-containing protein [Burkholderia cenocepacia]MCO8321920.1 helix-turn-helix transcriptional regulator [Burkholderia cenocepacia]MCO8329204.1 helix-turn-helix transcriptional regulator [Burkholderia cenocepacia]MCO8336675.1 helix-turn-helix transcriptional regulator [Burkholderia cenocepacia]MCO8343960.1 helix-turn-helix transcriptional regulator [Burkholderia cenocepacia]MCO8357057.1 helix-turn-helix transcriptional regulator [Burkholderia cenocepacia]
MSTSTPNAWTTGEVRLLARLYPSPIPSKALYAAFPRHPRKSVQIFARTVLKISRPPRDYKTVAAPAWNRMRAILESEQLSVRELVERCGVSQQRVSELLTIHRAEVQIVDWIPPVGRAQWRPVWAVGTGPDVPCPAAIKTAAARAARSAMKRNPFLAAAGLVTIPAGERGRVFQQPMDVDDDNLVA